MPTDPTYEAESLHTPESRERDARFVGFKRKGRQMTSEAPYGQWCAQCGAPIIKVTRGIPSMGTCKNGHQQDRRDCLRRDPSADLNQQALETARKEGYARAAKNADKLGYHCIGCGRIFGDPEKDMRILRKAGARSCCPERKMEPLSDALEALAQKDGE